MTEQTTTPETPQPPAGLTQERVNELVGSARTDGNAKGRAALLKDLGIETEEALKALVTSAREKADSEKNDLQKAIDAATVLKKKLADTEVLTGKTITALKANYLASEVKIAASLPAVDKTGKVIRPAFLAEALADIALLLDKSEIKEQEDGSYTGIEEALAELAKSKPYLLGTGTTQKSIPGTPDGQKKKVLSPVQPEVAERPASIIRL